MKGRGGDMENLSKCSIGNGGVLTGGLTTQI